MTDELGEFWQTTWEGSLLFERTSKITIAVAVLEKLNEGGESDISFCKTNVDYGDGDGAMLVSDFIDSCDEEGLLRNNEILHLRKVEFAAEELLYRVPPKGTVSCTEAILRNISSMDDVVCTVAWARVNWEELDHIGYFTDEYGDGEGVRDVQKLICDAEAVNGGYPVHCSIWRTNFTHAEFVERMAPYSLSDVGSE